MKKIYIASYITFLTIAASTASAQVFRTDESISSQIKNGTVPGTKISSEPAPTKVVNDNENPHKISVPVKQQLMDGTYPGLVVAKSATASPSAKTENKNPALPSDSKAAPAEENKQPVINIPSQEEKVIIENN